MPRLQQPVSGTVDISHHPIDSRPWSHCRGRRKIAFWVRVTPKYFPVIGAKIPVNDAREFSWERPVNTPLHQPARDEKGLNSRICPVNSRKLPGDRFAYDCTHHHPVFANRTFPIRRQIGCFCGDSRPLNSRILVSVCVRAFWWRFLAPCLRIQKFRSRRPWLSAKSERG
jgi:hypothetical protein